MTPSTIDRYLLRLLRKLIGPAELCLMLDGHTEENPPVTTPIIRIANRALLLELLLDPEMAFGEGYTYGRIEIEGDIARCLETVYRGSRRTRGPYSKAISRWMRWVQANTPGGSRRNIHHHYDLSTDFYKLWLDRELVYTCAYFPDENAELEEAQEAKLDLVCRKLRLRPGENVVEAGCGWGGLSLYMARRYGAKVKAFNISHEQIAYARARAEKEGLADKVEFVEDDYRNISGKFDVFVSVGMLEHVGKAHYQRLGEVIHKAIGDAGRGFLHFIGRDHNAQLSAWIRKRIFPGAYPPTLKEAAGLLEPHRFAIVDVENLREHYALTLEHWLSRFDRNYRQVVEHYGTNFARMWRLYLAGSAAAFRVGTLQLFQVLFAGRECNLLPMTRADLFEARTGERAEESWSPTM